MNQQSKSKNNSTPSKQKLALPLLLGIAIGVLLLVVAGYLMLPSTTGSSGNTIQNTGTPSLQVDKEIIDFGDVTFNDFVTASFNLTNTGDGLLEFTEPPYIELKEGC